MLDYTLRHNFDKKQRYNSFPSSQLIAYHNTTIYYFDQSKFSICSFQLPEQEDKTCGQYDLIPTELTITTIKEEVTDLVQLQHHNNILYYTTLESFNSFDLSTSNSSTIPLSYGEWNFKIFDSQIVLFSPTLLRVAKSTFSPLPSTLEFTKLRSSPINIFSLKNEFIFVFQHFFTTFDANFTQLKQFPHPAKVEAVTAEMHENNVILASRQRQILKISLEGKVLGTIQAATKYDPQKVLFSGENLLILSRSHEIIRQKFGQKNDRFSGVRGDAPWVGGVIAGEAFVGITEGGIYVVQNAKGL